MPECGVELMKKIAAREQAGFSLIETLIALTILSIGMLALGLLQIGAMKGNSNAAGRTNAVNIAQSFMDDLKARSTSDSLLEDSNNPAADFAYSPGSVTGADGRAYTVSWSVEANAPFSGAKTLTLFVRWEDQKFGASKVVMKTVIGGLF